MTRPSTHVVSSSAHIDADPAVVYAILADYRDGHPHILPKPFAGLVVEKGGVGAGTVITVPMRVFGRMQTFRAEISEPKPGRVLVERNVSGVPSVTTFFVNPARDTGTDITITTELETTRTGILGAIERMLMTRFLRPVYERELHKLAAVARERQHRSSGGRRVSPLVARKAVLMVAATALASSIASVGCSGRESVNDSHAKSPAARGEYLVTVADCSGCHTPLKMTPNGPEPDLDRLLSGHPEQTGALADHQPQGPWIWAGAGTNTAFAGPWGISYAANLTPDQNTGLGIWNEDMFIRALRTGKHMGTSRPILPPMPWPAFRHATDDDLSAIFAYLKTIKPVTNHVPEPKEPSAAATN